MDYVEAIKLLEEDRLNKAVFIYGEELYLGEYLLGVIKDKYLDQSSQVLNYEKIDMDKASFTKIVESVETLPFMAKKRIVELKGLDLSREGIGKKKDFYKDLEAYLGQISEDTILVINSTSGKFFKGSLFKEAEKNANIIQTQRLNRKELANFIGKKLASHNLRISRQLLNKLIDGLGYENKDLNISLYDVNNEVEKITSSASGKIRESDLEGLYRQNLVGNIFKLTDAICSFNPKEAIENFMILNKDSDDYRVLYMIIRQFRNLINIKLLKKQNRKDYDIKKTIGLKDYEYKKLLNFEKNYSIEELKDIYEKIYMTELNLKSGKGSYQTNMIGLISSISGK